jgi:hypothetical protein
MSYVENRNRVDIGDLPAATVARVAGIMTRGLTLHGYS